MEPDQQSGSHAHIRAKVIIEVLGKPKEHVEKTIREYVDKIKQDNDLVVLKDEYHDAEEKGDLWATFVELEMVIKGFQKLTAFCFEYMPSSIEIVKPEEMTLKKEHLETLANDLQARLHHVDMVVKKLDNENKFLKLNMDKMIQNLMSVALASGAKNKELLMKMTGIHEQEMQVIIDDLKEKNVIAEKDGEFSLVTN